MRRPEEGGGRREVVLVLVLVLVLVVAVAVAGGGHWVENGMRRAGAMLISKKSRYP
jgi:NhaP-type Na+/H+ or K+/H+ antiporter